MIIARQNLAQAARKPDRSLGSLRFSVCWRGMQQCHHLYRLQKQPMQAHAFHPVCGLAACCSTLVLYKAMYNDLRHCWNGPTQKA